MSSALDRLNEELDDFVQTLKAERNEAALKLDKNRAAFEARDFEILKETLSGKNVSAMKKVIKLVVGLKS